MLESPAHLPEQISQRIMRRSNKWVPDSLTFVSYLTECWLLFRCTCCLAFLPQGKQRWKGSPHGQKGKALCDVQTFAVREATRMTQDKHFHYVSKAEQMQSGQTLGLEKRWHRISVWVWTMSKWTSEPTTRDHGYAWFYKNIKITTECHESELISTNKACKVHLAEAHLRTSQSSFKIKIRISSRETRSSNGIKVGLQTC